MGYDAMAIVPIFGAIVIVAMFLRGAAMNDEKARDARPARQATQSGYQAQEHLRAVAHLLPECNEADKDALRQLAKQLMDKLK